jgi:hypothetical protein
VFIGLSVAALLGMRVRAMLPSHHLSTDSKEVIRLATAIVGTLSALALGLLIASAKGTFDDAERDMRSSAARLVLLDRVMAHYGPETVEARTLLRKLVEGRLRRGWSAATIDQSSQGSAGEYQEIEAVQDRIRSLSPKTDMQRFVQARALEVSGNIAEAHWLIVETDGEGLPLPFLITLIFWLALLFATFGLQAPNNATVAIILFICALCVGGAIFLIIDMAHPYLGVIHISGEPLQSALGRLGQP